MALISNPIFLFIVYSCGLFNIGVRMANSFISHKRTEPRAVFQRISIIVTGARRLKLYFSPF